MNPITDLTLHRELHGAAPVDIYEAEGPFVILRFKLNAHRTFSPDSGRVVVQGRFRTHTDAILAAAKASLGPNEHLLIRPLYAVVENLGDAA